MKFFKWILCVLSTEDELINKGGESSFSRSSRSKSESVGMEKMEERYPARRPRNAERAKTSFSLESRGIKERGGEEGGGGRARDRWSLLVACRLPSTLDAVYSSYPSTHSSLGSAGPLALDGKH